MTVKRTETSYSIINPDGTKSKPIYEIKDFPKTNDSNRDIPLTNKSLKYISMILETNAKHGFTDSKYLFINDKEKRITRKGIAGHSDLSVTNPCYVFNRNPKEATLSAFNKAL